MEEHLHMTSQTMVNKIHMTSSQAMINIQRSYDEQSNYDQQHDSYKSKPSSPTIHKKITATTHKMTIVM